MTDQRRVVWVAAVMLACSMLASPAHAQVCGDADGSGSVTVTDGVQILRAAAGLSTLCTTARCDVDENGAVSVTQAYMQDKIVEADGACYEPEFGYWKGK